MKWQNKIAVIGGGIAGLSAALEISDRFGKQVEILEASSSVGGTVSTICKDGFVLERGPDSFLADKETLDFCSRIGIRSRLAPTSGQGRKVFIMEKGAPVALPDGFFMIAPRSVIPFLTSPLFSVSGKLRALAEIFIPARSASLGDESVASFVRRRFGDEILSKAAAPLVGGIYCAPPETLGAESVLREFVKMEREHGSVLRALRGKNEDKSGGARFGGFFSPLGGMSEMVDATVKTLPGGCIKTGFRVSGIFKKTQGWEIVSDCGRSTRAAAVVVAVPCGAAASMLSGMDVGLSHLLGSVEHSSCAVAALVYETATVPRIPHGFGLLIPYAREGEVFACSFLSRKFPQRAPEGFSIIRFFIAGGICAASDGEIISRAQEAAGRLFGAAVAPCAAAVGKYGGQMPVCAVGHKDLVGRITAAADELGGLFFAGAGYGGVGIPDCIRGGKRAGAEAAAFVS